MHSHNTTEKFSGHSETHTYPRDTLSAESSADGSLAANASETQACSLQAPEHHVHCTQCIYGDVNWLEAGSGRLAAQGLDAAQLSLRVFY